MARKRVDQTFEDLRERYQEARTAAERREIIEEYEGRFGKIKTKPAPPKAKKSRKRASKYPDSWAEVEDLPGLDSEPDLEQETNGHGYARTFGSR